LNEDTLLFKLFNLASVVKVNEDDLGSVEGNVVLEAVFVVLCLAGIVIGNSVTVLSQLFSFNLLQLGTWDEGE